MDRKFRVLVEVTYLVDVAVSGKDEDDAVDSVDGIVAKLDDYEIVNRSHDRSMKIREVKDTNGH